MNKEAPVEVLYHPRTNKIALFFGEYRFNMKQGSVTIVLRTDVDNPLTVEREELVHLGWL